MGTGYLKIVTSTANGNLPVQARVTIYCSGGTVLYEIQTDNNGITETVTLEAPPIELALDPAHTEAPYSIYSVKAESPGFRTVTVHTVRIFDTITSILPVNMTPGWEERGDEYHIPVHQLLNPITQPIKKPEIHEPLQEAQVPEHIMIHLGSPHEDAPDIQVSFTDYVKIVASQVIFPSWPPAAIEANIYAITSLALNRICTKWYKQQDLAAKFDITGSAIYDQPFVQHGQTYQNVNDMVDRIHNRYIKREGFPEPYFAQYCDGRHGTCIGLWQWGAVGLAMRGLNALEILRYYYPLDVGIVVACKAHKLNIHPCQLPETSSGKLSQAEQSYEYMHTDKLLAMYLVARSMANTVHGGSKPLQT